MKKDNLIKLIKSIYNLDNEQQVREKLDEIDLLIEELFKYMEEKKIEKIKIGNYINLEIGVRKGRDYTNPKTKEESVLPDKNIRKIKSTKKINEI